MKKITLLLATLAIPSLGMASETYQCPSVGEAAQLIASSAKSWGDWTIVASSSALVPVAANNATFLFVNLPGAGAGSGSGQTAFAVGCNYTAESTSPPGETAFLNLTHNKLETYQGVSGSWTDAGHGWLKCNATDPAGCQFSPSSPST